jgi:hypothetical protein
VSYSNTFSNEIRGTKVYAEVLCVSQDTSGGGAILAFGLASDALPLDNTAVGSGSNSSIGYFADGSIAKNGAIQSFSTPWLAGDRCGIQVDTVAQTVAFRNITQGGSWSASVSLSGLSPPLYLVVSLLRLGDTVTANFDGPLLGAPSGSGYTRWDGSALLAAATGFMAASEAADTAAVAGAVTGAPPITVTLPGGYREPLRPALVEGVGYGVLPELEGEAHGDVLAASTGAATLRLAGVAAGAAGATGRGLTRLRVRAVAHGVRGSTGAAAAVVLGPGADGSGAIGARGKSSGVIGNLKGEASGRHDDDEAVAWLLVA